LIDTRLTYRTVPLFLTEKAYHTVFLSSESHKKKKKHRLFLFLLTSLLSLSQTRQYKAQSHIQYSTVRLIAYLSITTEFKKSVRERESEVSFIHSQARDNIAFGGWSRFRHSYVFSLFSLYSIPLLWMIYKVQNIPYHSHTKQTIEQQNTQK